MVKWSICHAGDREPFRQLFHGWQLRTVSKVVHYVTSEQCDCPGMGSMLDEKGKDTVVLDDEILVALVFQHEEQS